MSDTQERRCGRCGGTKHLSEFYIRKNGTTNPWCKTCYRDWYVTRNGGMVTVNCSGCGAAMSATKRKASEPRTYCSRKCKDVDKSKRRAAERLAGKSARSCLHCAAAIGPERRSDAIFCSVRCNEAAHAMQRKYRARTGDETKMGWVRAEICERDRWRCGICGGGVDQAKSHPDPLCASLDHVVPVSEGGSNDVTNLRLTHLRCNVSRRNRGGGEQLAIT